MLSLGPLEIGPYTQRHNVGNTSENVSCVNILHHVCCGRKQLGIIPLEIRGRDVQLMISSGLHFFVSLCPLLYVSFILNLNSFWCKTEASSKRQRTSFLIHSP